MQWHRLQQPKAHTSILFLQNALSLYFSNGNFLQRKAQQDEMPVKIEYFMADFSIGAFESELAFRTSRSGGSGGQHVNKVETKVELHFDVLNSAYLSEGQKRKILDKLKNRINKRGILRISSESERSQLANKKKVIVRFYELLKECLKKRKKRLPTKPSFASKEKRLRKKKEQSVKKVRRKKNAEEEE